MPRVNQLEIETRRRGSERVIVAPAGEIDLATAPGLEAALERAVEEGAEGVLLDLDQVSFIDSTGLRTVLAARDRCRERGQQFEVTEGSGQVKRLFAITGIGAQLDVVVGEPD